MSSTTEEISNNQKWLNDMRAGKLKIGCNLNLNNSVAGELLASMGYDWVLVDTQHSPVNRETLVHLLQAIKLGGAKSFVRVEGPQDRAGIQQCVDCGADGIFVPYVNTAEDIRQVVSYAKYPTVGTRSLYVNLRPTFEHGAGLPGLMGYYTRANSDVMVAVQIETKSAIDNLDEITAVKGLDLAFIGPGDLASSLGLLHKGFGAFADPLFVESVGKTLGSCQKNGVIPGFWSTTVETVQAGFKFLAAGSDIEYMRQAAEKNLTDLKSSLEFSGWTPRKAPIDPSKI